MPRTPAPLPLTYRLGTAARVAAALAGGYAVAALAAIALAWGLPMERPEAVTLATIVALLVWPLAAMACFWVRTALRAWIAMGGAVALLAGIAMLGGWRP